MKHCSLYIHIPFCLRKCAYCDFVSFPNQTNRIDEYIARLEREMADMSARYGALCADTLFIGGGTPSLLTGAQMSRLMNAVRAHFALSDNAEITCEANPGTLEPFKLCAYRELGINRLSIGVQAFDDRLLRQLGRIHCRDEAIQAVYAAHDAGFDNLSVDLMYALPGQSISDWMKTLEAAAALPLAHISCYSLIVEDFTPMKALFDSQPVLFPDDETAVTMQHMAADFLHAQGFERYEISNYARPGCESRHNLVYWTRGDYLGLGCAAHSLMNGARFANVSSLDGYLTGEQGDTAEYLTEKDIYEETVMLGLRTRRGVETALLPQDKLKRLLSAGLMTLEGTRARVTPAGADVLNAIILELI